MVAERDYYLEELASSFVKNPSKETMLKAFHEVIHQSAIQSSEIKFAILEELRKDFLTKDEFRAEMKAFKAEFKQDIAELEKGLKMDMFELEKGLKTDVAEIKAATKSFKWIMGLQVTLFSLVIALVGLTIKFL